MDFPPNGFFPSLPIVLVTEKTILVFFFFYIYNPADWQTDKQDYWISHWIWLCVLPNLKGFHKQKEKRKKRTTKSGGGRDKNQFKHRRKTHAETRVHVCDHCVFFHGPAVRLSGRSGSPRPTACESPRATDSPPVSPPASTWGACLVYWSTLQEDYKYDFKCFFFLRIRLSFVGG